VPDVPVSVFGIACCVDVGLSAERGALGCLQKRVSDQPSLFAFPPNSFSGQSP